METTTMTKAFGYLRVSSDGQIDGDGFTRQRVAIEKWAAVNGVTIVQWFEEEGVSGTVAERPALQRMMVALLSNGVRTVVIEKLDRIARDVLIQETIIQNMQQEGFQLISTMEADLCSQDPSRTLMRQIMGAFAQYDRTMIVLKTRAARERIRKSGVRCEGRKIYGQNAKPALAQAEQAIIARIRAMYAAGSNYEQIAKQLNAEGVASRKGSWFGSTVRRIVIAQYVP
jgi:DNA invertase Pin-like site-specific DNA recombinase